MLDSSRVCNDNVARSETKLEGKGASDIGRRTVIEKERYLLNSANGQSISYVDFTRYCNSIATDMQIKENTLIRRREAKNRFQLVNNELKLERQRIGWILFTSVLLLVVVCIASYCYYRNRVRLLADAEDRVDILTRMMTETKTLELETKDLKQAILR